MSSCVQVAAINSLRVNCVDDTMRAQVSSTFWDHMDDLAHEMQSKES